MSDNKKTAKPNVHAGHRERMRTRYKRSGFDDFQPHEVLEFMLFRTIPRANTNPIAHNLINHFGSFYNVLCATYDELLEVEGIGPKSAEMILEIGSLGRKAKLDEIASTPLKTWDKLYLYTTEWFAGKLMGTVAVILLDASRKVIQTCTLAEEHLRRPMDYAETILVLCQKHGASNAVLMHNHADGVMAPSIEDLDLTKSIYDILEANGITLLEHVIVWKLDAIPCLNEAMQKELSGFPLKHVTVSDYRAAEYYLF